MHSFPMSYLVQGGRTRYAARLVFPLVLVLLVLAGLSCGGEEPKPAANAEKPKKAPAKKGGEKNANATPVAEPHVTADWVKALPARQVEAQTGDRVWAAVPRPDLKAGDPAIAMYKISAVNGNEASVESAFRKYAKVPGALVIKNLPDSSALKVGDIATGFDPLQERPVLGRVTKIEENGVTVKTWLGANTSEKRSSYAAPVSPAVAPLHWIAYVDPTNPNRYNKGFVILVDGERVFVVNAAGSVEIVNAQQVKPLEISTDYSPGERVLAFAFGTGYQPAVIKSVQEPGFLYQVESKDGTQTITRTLFFGDLTKQAL